MFARDKSNYGNPVPDHTAVTDPQYQNRVFDHFTAVADHKEIQRLTHTEDSVEDNRTTDLAWLTQDQD